MPVRALHLLLCSTLLFASACSSGEIARRTDRFDHEAAAVSSLRLSSTNGNLECQRRGDVERLELDVVLQVGGASEEEAAERLRTTQVRTTFEGGELSAWVEFPDPRHDLDEAHLFVRAPLPVAAVLKTANGAIRCTDLERGIDAHTRNGAIEIRGRHADVLARSVNGAVAITGVLGRAKGETKNGSLELELGDGAQGGFELANENGAIEISVPRALRGHILLQTANGELEVAGAPTVEEKSEGQLDQLRIELGVGSASVARTENGSVRCVVR
ncbi:MAG: hypothetical protein IPN34_26220 [Planctomycetes bacterium]|nr:hypothetical protein [Planctomycetota bacterium]